MVVAGDTGTKETATKTLTGIVDQHEGKFVLADEEEIRPIAVLRGRGFKDTNFARFVGLRVQVSGEMVTEGGQQVLYVPSLSHIKQIEARK
jgi:hypothetical protein